MTVEIGTEAAQFSEKEYLHIWDFRCSASAPSLQSLHTSYVAFTVVTKFYCILHMINNSASYKAPLPPPQKKNKKKASKQKHQEASFFLDLNVFKMLSPYIKGHHNMYEYIYGIQYFTPENRY
jgi:hypothetical protein